jgi:hypothetical protein
MKHIAQVYGHKFSPAELVEILTPFIPDGWEAYEVQSGGLKIRKPYDANEIAFNEDGYKYDMLWVEFGKTRHYLRLIELGYTFSKDFKG